MTIDEIFIALGLKTDGVKQGAKEAESAISGMTSSIVAKLSVLSAGAAAALSVFSRFGEYVGQADAMGKLANALDVDIEKMHAWGEAAARAGGSVEGFQSSLEQMQGQLSRIALTGTSRMKTIFEGAGIDAGEIGRQRDSFAVMMDLAEKAETMSKAEFFGLGRSLGLDRGTIMLLQQGRAALKEQIRLQKEFGVYTKEDAKLTADWNDRVADFGQVMKSFSAIVFRMVLPAMTKFVEIVNKAVAFLRRHEKFVQAFFIGLATVITAVLLPALAKMAAAWLANPMTLTITALVAALVGLALVFEDLAVWAENGESAFGDLWTAIFGSPKEAMDTWENLKKFFEDTWTAIKNFCLNIWNSMDDDFNTFVQRMVRVIDGIKSAFEAVANVVRSIFKTADEGAARIGNVQTMDASQYVDEDGNPIQRADGGIFTSPTRALIGEAGAEAVIPFSAGKRNRGIELLSKIAGNFVDVSAANALPMGGAGTINNNTTDTRVTVGTVNINAADGTDAAGQFMNGIEQRAQMWTAAANIAY